MRSLRRCLIECGFFAPNHLVVKVQGVEHRVAVPIAFSWSEPPVEAIQENAVAIQQYWVECLRMECGPETSGLDNLKTLELVFGSYESAEMSMPYVGENYYGR